MSNIAVCGIDCDTCEARIATITNDNTLKIKVAKEWSILNNTQINPEDINCEGCNFDGKKTVFCSNLCDIRKCAKSKEYLTCASCESKICCSKLSMITSNNQNARDNLLIK